MLVAAGRDAIKFQFDRLVTEDLAFLATAPLADVAEFTFQFDPAATCPVLLTSAH